MDGWPYEKELEQGPPDAELMRNFEKSSNLAEQFTNRVDDHIKSADEYPERLPVPLPLKIQPYKKSNSQYRTYLTNPIRIVKMILSLAHQSNKCVCVCWNIKNRLILIFNHFIFFSFLIVLDMTICHFKICNMGKRDTSHQRF